MSRQYFPMNVLVAACIFVLATLYSLSIVQQANAYTVYSLAKWATVPNSSQRIPRYTESNLYIQYAGNSGWVPSLRDAIAQWNEQSRKVSVELDWHKNHLDILLDLKRD